MVGHWRVCETIFSLQIRTGREWPVKSRLGDFLTTTPTMLVKTDYNRNSNRLVCTDWSAHWCFISYTNFRLAGKYDWAGERVLTYSCAFGTGIHIILRFMFDSGIGNRANKRDRIGLRRARWTGPGISRTGRRVRYWSHWLRFNKRFRLRQNDFKFFRSALA